MKVEWKTQFVTIIIVFIQACLSMMQEYLFLQIALLCVVIILNRNLIAPIIYKILKTV